MNLPLIFIIMIVFNELKINKAADVLTVSVKVKDKSYYEDVYLDKIYINTEDTYVEGNPAKNPVYSYTVEDLNIDADVNQDGKIDISDEMAIINHIAGIQEYERADVNKDGKVDVSDILEVSKAISEGVQPEGRKEISLNINGSEIAADLSSHLFFVSVVTKGTPSPDTPCGMDNQITTGVTLSLCRYYSTLLGHLKELGDTCEVPMGLVDQLLKWEALNISIASGHYTKSIEYFKKWFSNSSVTVNTGCGCHGR